MIELEVLFKSGQGLLIALEDRESALLFMKHALDARTQNLSGLFHLSTSGEEILIDLCDLSLIRLKKEQIPLLGTKLRLQEGPRSESAAAENTTAESGADTASPKSAEPSPQADTPPTGEQPSQRKKTPEAPPAATPPQGPQSRAEAKFQQAEARLQQLEQQRNKLEAELARERAALEDAAREAQLKASLEALEIEQEIARRKENPPT